MILVVLSNNRPLASVLGWIGGERGASHGVTFTSLCGFTEVCCFIRLWAIVETIFYIYFS